MTPYELENRMRAGLRPTCYVCQKPVDVFEAYLDLNRMQEKYRVRCHGEIEEVSLSFRDVASGSMQIEITYAFQPKNEVGLENHLVDSMMYAFQIPKRLLNE